MEVALVGRSALEYWQRYRCRQGRQVRFPLDEPPLDLEIDQAARTPAVAPRDDEVEVLRASDPLCGALSLPLQLAVAKPAARCESALKHCHALTESSAAWVRPSGAVELLVLAPPHLAAWCAREFPPVALIQLLFGLVGHYVPRPADAMVPAVPLTSVDALASFARACSNVPGVRRLSSALPCVTNHAGSPMETALALLFSLPRARGGYGLPLPQLNPPFTLDPRRALAFGRERWRPDLLWPASSLIVEYDGRHHHEGDEHVARDDRRRNDLASLGYTVLTVTAKQLFDSGAFYALAHQVARHLGVRLRHGGTAYDWGERHAALRSQLLYQGVPAECVDV